MSDGFSNFLEELQEDGEVEESSTGFTLRSDKAREKLKKFALAHPENYFLLVIGGLHTLGARTLTLRVDADDLELEGDTQVHREELKDLWSCVAGGGQQENREGLRLLALAVLTSVRFDSAVWTIQSSDSVGGYRWRQDVKSGELPEPVFEECDTPPSGLRISVKRKSLRQVAWRFLSQLTSRLTSQPWQEETMIRERVFLGIFEEFRLNARSLDCGLSSQPVQGIRRLGGVPTFLESRYSFRSEGSFPMACVICDAEEGEDLPGEAGTISWLWHGLHMGRSDLKLPYKFCRVYLCADGMQTDLSFSAIPDTWERQKAERAAREAVRDLLRELAEEYTRRQGEGPESCDPALEQTLLEVIAERIDTKRSRHRLASFNRTLLECPLFWGVDGAGEHRRYTLNELWERMEGGAQIASFENPRSNYDIPLWQGLPLILLGDMQLHRTLSKVFGAAHLEAGQLVERVRGLLERAARREQQASSRADNRGSGPRGTLEWSQGSLEWSLNPLAESGKPGLLVVTSPSGNDFFEDDSLGIPHGLTLRGALPWAPNYQGRLADPKLASGLPHRVLVAVAEYLGDVEGKPEADHCRLVSLLWKFLGANLSKWNAQDELYRVPWLPVFQPKEGWTWSSPREAFPDSSNEPLYALPTKLPEPFPKEAYGAPCWVIPSGFWDSLERSLGRRVVDARGWELLAARDAVEFGEEFFVLDFPEERLANLDARLSLARVALPKKGSAEAHKLQLYNMLYGHALKMKSLSSFMEPMSLRLDWKKGWPGPKGLHFANKDQAVTANECADYLAFWVAEELALQLSEELVRNLEPKCLASAWFETWTDVRLRHEPWLLRSDGSKVSPHELEAPGEPVPYFSDFEELPEDSSEVAVWLPPEVAEAPDLISESVRWYHFLQSPPEPPSASHEVDVPVSQELVRPPVEERVVPLKLVEPLKTSHVEEKVPDSRPLTLPPPEDEPAERKDPELSRAAAPVLHEPESPEEPSEKCVEELPSPVKGEKAAPKTSSSERPPVREVPLYHRFLLDCFEGLPLETGRAFRSEFREFLTRISWSEDQAAPLISEDGALSLAQLRTPLNAEDQETAMIVLSALYSVFNRKYEKVVDAHERLFHRAVLARCEELFLGGLSRSS